MNEQDSPQQLSFDFLIDREISYEEVRGTVHAIIYENPETGWKVIDIDPAKEEKRVRIAGFLPGIQKGDTLVSRCTVNDHPQFGPCLQVDEFEKDIPFDRDSLIRYLVSQLDGIGPVRAEKIVTRFGSETLAVLKESPERLLELEGLTPDLVEKIRKSLLSLDRNLSELVLLGFTLDRATRIAAKYSDKTLAIIKKNPFQLIDDFKGIGFKTADNISRKLGLPRTGHSRIQAGIRYVLKSSIKKTGHNYLTLSELTRWTAKLLTLPYNYILGEILSSPGLVIEEDRVYLPRFYKAEKTVAENIVQRLSAAPVRLPGLDARLEKIEKDLSISFEGEQVEAIKTALSEPVSIITGAAGTGKSTLCRGLVRILESYNLSCRICAPTGRAANKLHSLTGYPVSTIHRLLRYSPREGFRINRSNPLVADYLIVDEASMVGLLLLEALLEGTSFKTRIVFIGDPYQIPPVDPGDTLKSMSGSYSISQVTLPRVFRQKSGSTILRNASMINLDKPFPLESTEDFRFYDIDDPVAMIRSLFKTIIDLKNQGYDPIKDIHVLTPLNTGGGDISVSNLNRRLRDWLNPVDKTEVYRIYNREFRKNDKVMQRRNDYDLELYNGDIGFVTGCNDEDSSLELEFSDGTKDIPFNRCDHLCLAYAMTVHKSQGSENRATIFLATRSGCFFLLNKNLFYTAMTRAREKLVMIMPYDAVKMALRASSFRHSHLAERIQQLRIGKEPPP